MKNNFRVLIIAFVIVLIALSILAIPSIGDPIKKKIWSNPENIPTLIETTASVQNEFGSSTFEEESTQEVADSQVFTEDPIKAEGEIKVTNIFYDDDHLLIQGTLLLGPSNLAVNHARGFFPDTIVRDAVNNVYIPEIVIDDKYLDIDGCNGQTHDWVFQIEAGSITWPLTITINSVPAESEPYATSYLNVDVGNNPKIGQKWNVNKDIPLGPKTVRFVSIERKQTDSKNGYELVLIQDFDLSFFPKIVSGAISDSSGHGAGLHGEPFWYFQSYPGEVPTGLLTIEINGTGTVTIVGPWQITVPEPL